MTYRKLINPRLFSRDQVKPAKCFSGCFFISCKSSKDRRRVFLKNAKIAGLEPVWVPGIQPSLASLEKMGFENIEKRPRLKGNVGCTASHFQAISEARRLGLESVLLFEDDVAFSSTWNEDLEAVTDELGTLPWDLLYLGGVPKKTNHANISPGLWKAAGVWSTPAIAMHSRYFDHFLSYLDRPPINVIDCFLFHEAVDRFFLLTEKPLNWQREVASVTGGNIQTGMKKRAENLYKQNLQPKQKWKRN